MKINITDLPIEVLLHIFEFCDIYDLCKLRQCNTFFNKIIISYKIPLYENRALVTNQVQKSMRNRCLNILEPYEKWRISHNWKIGKYKYQTLLPLKKKRMPWLLLDKNFLWTSRERYIECYKRKTDSYVIWPLPKCVLNTEDSDDVVRFKIRNNFLISGKRNGGISIWLLDEESLFLHVNHSHTKDVTDVDLTKDVYVSGSNDKCFKTWKLNVDAIPQLLYCEHMRDKVWCVNICPNRTLVAVGTAGFNDVPPLHVFEIERCTSLFDLEPACKKGAGILDMHWDNDNTCLVCGYDTYLRRFDLRTGRFEQSWMDPFDAFLYCVSSDSLYSVVCGTNTCGRAVLWDQRVTKNYIQMYYTCTINSRFKSNSPVYSIGFDSCQLFTGLDRCVKCLDFSGEEGTITNYSGLVPDYLYYS